MDNKLSKEDYLQILRNKKSQGSKDFADKVLYRGKLMGRCPAGTSKMGNTCIEGDLPNAPNGAFKRKDLGGIAPEQARLLSQGKKKPKHDLK